MRREATDGAPGEGYRPAQDGVRALAVLAVIADHTTSRLPGGYLGVDASSSCRAT